MLHGEKSYTNPATCEYHQWKVYLKSIVRCLGSASTGYEHQVVQGMHTDQLALRIAIARFVASLRSDDPTHTGQELLQQARVNVDISSELFQQLDVDKNEKAGYIRDVSLDFYQ